MLILGGIDLPVRSLLQRTSATAAMRAQLIDCIRFPAKEFTNESKQTYACIKYLIITLSKVPKAGVVIVSSIGKAV